MAKYSCERCGKEFSRKSYYDSHNERKTPCVKNADKMDEAIRNLDFQNLILEEKNDSEVGIVHTIEPKTHNKSPLRYPGGKTRACEKLTDILKAHFNISDFNTIISPFFGGGSFEFHIQNTYDLKIIANDKFTPLYNFWNTCKSDKERICTELSKKIDTIDRDAFISMRETIIDEKIIDEDNKLKLCVMYFIINRCSFSGATLSGGFSLEASKTRFTQSSIDRIKNLNLNCFDIYNSDFEEIINANQEEKMLIFLDPPYYLEKGSKLYGNNGDMHETFDHDKLFKCLSVKKNWLMTYNNCEHIKDLYKGFKIIETNWSYGMNKSKKSSEIVIIG